MSSVLVGIAQQYYPFLRKYQSWVFSFDAAREQERKQQEHAPPFKRVEYIDVSRGLVMLPVHDVCILRFTIQQ
jgi:hypothetical protein